jgi:hypothetical protein
VGIAPPRHVTLFEHLKDCLALETVSQYQLLRSEVVLLTVGRAGERIRAVWLSRTRN